MADAPLSPQLSAPSPPRKRRRPAKSCRTCRKRKVACDKQLPCGSCLRSRAALQCSYRRDETPRSPGGSLSEEDSAADGTDMSPIDRSSTAVVPNSESHQTSALLIRHKRARDPVPATRHADRTREDLQDRIHWLEEQLTIERQARKDTRTLSSQPLAARRDQARRNLTGPNKESSIITKIPNPSLRLRNTPRKTRLFGPTHWQYIAEQLNIAQFDDEAEPELIGAKAELGDLILSSHKLRHQIKTRKLSLFHQPVPNVLESLPGWEVCEELLNCYLRTFEPVYRVIHVPSFRQDFMRCMQEGSWHSTPTHFHMKLLLVLAIGTVFYVADDETIGASLHDKAHMWMYSAQWWLTGPTEKATHTIDGLQIYCLLMIARQSICNAPGISGWVSSGSLVTMALSLGLHRSAHNFRNLSPCEREIRSRLWVTVLELNLRHSFDLATPLPVDSYDFDASAPLNINDEDMNPEGHDIPLARTGFTDSSIQLMLAKTLGLRLGILRNLNDFRAEQSYDEALRLGASLRTACRDIAAFFQANSSAGVKRAADQLKPTEFHRKLLDIYMRKFVLLVHTPFMLRALKDPQFYLARKTCVESALVIASFAKDMDFKATNRKPDDLARLAIVGRGLYKGPLGIDIIIILALEVIKQLEDANKPQEMADPLDELQRASRAPLISALKIVRDRLHQTHALGSVSFMRSSFIIGLLSQISAMEAGDPVKPAVYEALTSWMRQCDMDNRQTLDDLPSTADMISGTLTDSSRSEWVADDTSSFPYDFGWGIIDPASTWVIPTAPNLSMPPSEYEDVYDRQNF